MSSTSSPPQKLLTLLFVHSKLDDLGLTAAEFRVYAHISRRANNGVAWPGIASISSVCRLHPTTVRRCLKSLQRRQMISIEPRAGETSHYILNDPAVWSAPIGLTPVAGDTPPSQSQSTPVHAMQGHPCASEAGKGIPSEGRKEKKIQIVHAGASEFAAVAASPKPISITEMAGVIYDAYPRQMSRPRSLSAIQRALKIVPFEKLLATTKHFAELWRNAPDVESRYCPSPYKWFSEERFNDAPQSWRYPSTSVVPIQVRMSTLEKLIRESPAILQPGCASDDDRRKVRKWKQQLTTLREQALSEQAGQ